MQDQELNDVDRMKQVNCALFSYVETAGTVTPRNYDQVSSLWIFFPHLIYYINSKCRIIFQQHVHFEWEQIWKKCISSKEQESHQRNISILSVVKCLNANTNISMGSFIIDFTWLFANLQCDKWPGRSVQNEEKWRNNVVKILHINRFHAWRAS